ncbi:unnamed protein product [Commensalibacter communis]|uniref:hypothetical protein n=1 Tax=Commensalibacter communis TaxID=2972786 RepID=UPI0022FF7D1C|nr:hypothetical protein [Commensalibacter communis]CAI3945993.1 unnamed protein product [Commensalibacter communis]
MKYKLFIFFLIIGSSYNHTGFSETRNSQIIQGPFKTDLYLNGEIYFTRKEDNNTTIIQKCYPITFFLKYTKNNVVKQEKVAQYTQNGGCPEVRSVFFGNLYNKKYIFVMIIWDSDHDGVGMKGDFYQTYAYTKNKEGILSLDKTISDDELLSGFEGYDNCKSDINPEGIKDCYETYKYKTAAEVKKYLKQKYQ